MSTSPNPQQAAKLYLSRKLASDNLTSFARYIPIPSVPLDTAPDNAFDVVETPLAAHHLLILEALEAMVRGHLFFIRINGACFPVLDGMSIRNNDLGALDTRTTTETTLPCPTLPCREPGKTPTGDRTGWGVAIGKKYPHLSKFLKTQTPPYSCLESILQENQSLENSEKKFQKKSAKNRGKTPSKQADLVASQEIWARLVREHKVEVCRRVMLMLPPGSAKSTYASVVFPSWEMGRMPNQEIILTGYGDVICKKHGKRGRQLCNNFEFQNVFGCSLDPDTRAADEWQLTNGSSYKASGILSGITGFRCDGLIWDDLTKGRKEADSFTIRNDTYNAYVDDARSRKKPTAWEVGIGTRWHEDEIMGRILPEGFSGESGFMDCRDGNTWFVLCIAAQAEREDDPLGRAKGEYIWQEWFGEGYWADKKINPRTWASLYQQRPAPEEGIYFKMEWVKRYNNLPDNLNYYVSFDPAVSEAEDADDTCVQVWGVDHLARIYLVEEWCGKVTMDMWINILLDKVQRYRPLEVVSESGVIRRASEPFITREMRNRKIFANFQWVGRNSDKPAMSRSLQAMMAAGQVFFPDNSDGENTIDEFLRFPAAKSDHRVDAAANLCLRLETIWESNPPDTVKENPVILGEGIPISQLMPPRHVIKRSRWSRR